MSLVPDGWTPHLARAVAAAIREFHRSTLKDNPVVVFDLGCFPWHGRIELSFLTAADLDADAALLDRSEVASWPHYNFTFARDAWRTEVDAVTGQQMAAIYQKTKNDGDMRRAVVEAFLRASAATVATPEVTAALNELSRDPRFQIWVQHPDTGRHFWPLRAIKA